MSERIEEKEGLSPGVPIFAVVGRVNKGKSSIVSTLVEDDQVDTSREPGTTRSCQIFHRRLEGQPLFAIVDTPGFEDAPRALQWLQARERNAGERPALVRAFVEYFKEGVEFREECALLAPILAGAAVLYVVDASRPYRPNYDAEMEILRWTGRPRMALINRIGEADHSDAWREILNQYFNIVRTFDAFRAGPTERVGLLTALRELDEASRPAIDRALADLVDEGRRRTEAAARAIADLLAEALTFVVDVPARDRLAWDEARQKEVEERFHQELRRREARERHAVESLYQHARLRRRESSLERPIFERDLFAVKSWQVLGLAPGQLVRVGIIGGAALGGVIDLGVGGASLFTGTLVGGVVGGVSSYLAGRTASKARVLHMDLGGDVLRVGPLKNPNFPWILLDRALLHYTSVAERAHARRDEMVLADPDSRAGIVHRLPTAEQHSLSRLFAKIQKKGAPVSLALRQDLATRISALLGSTASPPPTS